MTTRDKLIHSLKMITANDDKYTNIGIEYIDNTGILDEIEARVTTFLEAKKALHVHLMAQGLHN